MNDTTVTLITDRKPYIIFSCKVISGVPPNTGMQRTALCAHKIGAFLKAGIGATPVPIYWCAAADAQTVGWQPV